MPTYLPYLTALINGFIINRAFIFLTLNFAPQTFFPEEAAPPCLPHAAPLSRPKV